MTQMTGPSEPAAPTEGWGAAVVRSIRHTTARGVVLRLDVADRVDHLPGQHYVVRLTAEDGYTAQRSYSVSSPPSDPALELFVEGLPDGEVSGYLTQVAEPGDAFEVRGPIGGWFVWPGDTPALAVGGGSGVAPLVAMLRHSWDLGRPDLLRLAVAARTTVDLPYAGELGAAGALIALSRESSPTGRRFGRLRAEDLAPLWQDQPVVLVCGSTAFAESTTTLLTEIGVPADRIRVERFGPTG